MRECEAKRKMPSFVRHTWQLKRKPETAEAASTDEEVKNANTDVTKESKKPKADAAKESKKPKADATKESKKPKADATKESKKAKADSAT